MVVTGEIGDALVDEYYDMSEYENTRITKYTSCECICWRACSWVGLEKLEMLLKIAFFLSLYTRTHTHMPIYTKIDHHRYILPAAVAKLRSPRRDIIT